MSCFVGFSFVLFCYQSVSFQISNFLLKPLNYNNRLEHSASSTQFPRTCTTLRLDLEDILDDDVNFLEQLRKQIENPISASPKEVTNRIKAFFSKNTRNPREIEVFRSYLNVNKNVFDVVNSILIIDGCDKVNFPINDLTTEKAILDGMKVSSPLLTSSMVVRGINGMKLMSSDLYAKLLWDRIQDSQVLLTSPDVCSSIHFMSMAAIKPALQKNFLLLFARSLSYCELPLQSKAISSAIFGE